MSKQNRRGTTAGRKARITRRDFLQGAALAAGTCALSPLELLARQGGAAPYPPALTGLRGSQPGSFDVAHAIGWEGRRFTPPQQQTDGEYDLVVVGGGISGLAAAFFWRQRFGPDKRILILDNHDDFGGHARRNEFTVDDRLLVGYGGSQSIDTPSSYSPAASQLLKDVGIFTERFYDYFDQDFYRRRGMGSGIWFSREVYGRDVTAPGLDLWNDPTGGLSRDTIAAFPIGDAARSALAGLLGSDTNHLSDVAADERLAWLASHSYRDFLLRKAQVPEDVYYLFRDGMRGWWGVGWDAVSALEAARMEMPGTRHLDLPATPGQSSTDRDDPYIFHFPDGNAGVARALLRQLIPDAMPGESMEDLVLARADYGRLDRADNRCRLRLDSTAVDLRHAPGDMSVDVTYVRNGSVERVRGRHAIFAGYNAMLPHICRELPDDQREALGYAEKIPLVYITVALRHWRPFAELGMQQIAVPQTELMHSFGMDFPVSMGGVEFPQNPDQPALVHGSYIPCAPDLGLPPREQHRMGRREIYELSFDEFERRILRQLDGALGRAGLDVERDVAGLTVNRWPHGYAYEYNALYDPPEYGRDAGPHVLGARQLGRISVANSDAAAYAFVNGAIDAARRAVDEQSA
jgi:spermidine dehydrogenase